MTYELIYRLSQNANQLPFELKLTMPPTDKGVRDYSDEYLAKIKSNLLN